MKKIITVGLKQKVQDYEGEYIVPDVDFQSFYEHLNFQNLLLKKYLIIMINSNVSRKF